METNQKHLKVCLIILDFLKADRVVSNVKLLQKQKINFELQIIVADNSCNSKNAEKLQTLKELANVEVKIFKKNHGYTKAHNLALAKVKFDYLFIVNPDILIKDVNLLQNMLDYMLANPDIGVLGPKQINDDGSTTMTVRGWPNIFKQVFRRTFLRHIPIIAKIVSKDEMQHLDYNKVQAVPWLQSSFNLVRGDFFKQIGGLCEDYFLFMSDPELCWQAWKNNLKVIYYPKVQVYADGIRSSAGGFKDFFKKWVMRTHLKDSLTFMWKHLLERAPF